ncbi:ImmA/IrrE family metallo-endopeptidase [Corynebacterium ulcerans]|uniref:ImmA/IrrE family metallo-endopeptidase n=1 Tax=Corynebacterium ulcerans TaxID=65058 RepID=UPI0034A10C7C
MLLYQSARSWANKIRQGRAIESRGTRQLETFAVQLGASVFFRPLDPRVSGVIIKNEDEDPEIFINSDEHQMRQRFTLAHEIGHLVERMYVAEDADYSFIDRRQTKPGTYDLHEFFADEFAAELLMPAEEFLRVIDEKGYFGASSHFGVSVPAVKKRKERLEKHPHEDTYQ